MYFDTKDETDFEKYSLQYSYACNVFKVKVTLFLVKWSGECYYHNVIIKY